MIRPMAQAEEIDVRRLYEVCHPRWPRKPKHWYQAHPTLVLFHGATLLGFTSYSVGPPPTTLASSGETELMYGHGVYVHPDHRGKGYGQQLADARLKVCRALGLLTFVGMTQPDNAPMRAIFARHNMKTWGQVPSAYPDGAEALIYMGKP